MVKESDDRPAKYGEAVYLPALEDDRPQRRSSAKRNSRARPSLAHRILWHCLHQPDDWKIPTAKLFSDLLMLSESNPAVSLHVRQIEGAVVGHLNRKAAVFYFRKGYVLTYLCPELQVAGRRLLGERRYGRWRMWRALPGHLSGVVKILRTLPALSAGKRKQLSRSIPSHVMQEVLERDKGHCKRCGSQHDLHFDHILPFSRGGSSKTAKNIQLLCAICNLEKGASLRY